MKSIIPNSQKNKILLQNDHINFIKELLQDEEKIFFTINDIKKELIVAYPDLKNISPRTIREAMIKNGFSFKKSCTILRKVKY